jgi:hypothetical protein
MPTTGDFPLQLSLPLGTDPVDVSVLNANFEKINEYAIDNDADGSVSTGRLADGAVTTAKITDANVTAAKLAGTLDLTGKTVSVATPSSAAHAATKAYVDLIGPDSVVLASGSFSGGVPNITGLSTVGYRKLRASFNITDNSSNLSLGLSWNGATAYTWITSPYSAGWTASSSSSNLVLGILQSNSIAIIEIDNPGVSVLKTYTARSGAGVLHGRTAQGAAITTLSLVNSSFTGSGSYEIVGVK